MAVVLSVGCSSFYLHRQSPKFCFSHRTSSNLNLADGGRQILFKYHRFRCFKQENSDTTSNIDNSERRDEVVDVILGSQEAKTTATKSSLLAQLAILLGIAATVTLLSICLNQGPTSGIQILAKGASTSAVPSLGFSFNAFGYNIILPEYTPGWVYFWLLMAAGCGLFISEEALNIWVGISLARMLSLDGTGQSFVESLSKSAPHIFSTVLWVYWGVCISDMIPFYLGRLFKKSGASDDVYSKLGISKGKAVSLTRTVQRYGNLIGFVERFSLGVRNPTSFFAGALDISPECFFAGVCCGGLITLPIQLGIGFLLRERPVFALATVATVVGIWTMFPYAVAASTALFLYLRQRYSN
ncbi:putative SNARE associated golgi family protein [Helianthus annuus]|nr:putative SNARE associated golgi family protein [Helianthus annuus]